MFSHQVPLVEFFIADNRHYVNYPDFVMVQSCSAKRRFVS